MSCAAPPRVQAMDVFSVVCQTAFDSTERGKWQGPATLGCHLEDLEAPFRVRNRGELLQGVKNELPSSLHDIRLVFRPKMCTARQHTHGRTQAVPPASCVGVCVRSVAVVVGQKH